MGSSIASKTADTRRTKSLPSPWRGNEPPLLVPEFAPLGLSRIPMEQLSRHLLFTGETGSGKSDSAIRPVLRAVMRYPEVETITEELRRSMRLAMLLLDPKGDLTVDAKRVNRRHRLRRRIIELREAQQHVIHLFEGMPPGSIGVDEILERILVLSPSYHEDQAKTNSAFFILQAAMALRVMLAADHAIVAKHGVATLKVFWSCVGARVLQEIGSRPDDLRYNRVAYLRPHATLLALVSMYRVPTLQSYMLTCGEWGVPESVLMPLSSWLVMKDETVAAISATVNGFMNDLSGAFADQVSLNPYEPPPSQLWLSVRQALNEGWIVALTPNEHDPVDVAVATAVKGAFFAHAFERENKQRGFVYLADEAQMVLTMDRSAEHRFLDRCRAYRCAAVLATQGVNSLRFRLTKLAGRAEADPALEILLTNTGTKFFFRTTDPESRATLRKLIPEPELEGKAHVIDVCPPSMLRTGECYAVGSGGWSRGQVMVAKRDLASGG